MGVTATFKTIPEMFDVVTKKYLNSGKPVILRKIKNKFEPISYSEHRSNVNRFMLGLYDLGLKEGEKVAIISENRPEWIVSDISIISLGAIDVPIYPSLTAKQIEYILNNAEVRFAILSNQFQLTKVSKIIQDVPTLEKIIMMNEKFDPQEKAIKFSDLMKRGEELEKINKNFFENNVVKRKPEDVATIIYTSGTTGDPKGVILTNSNFISQVIDAPKTLPILDTDTFLSFLPLCHVFERTATSYVCFACGGTIAFAENIDKVAENMIEVKPTVVTTVPRLFERMQSKIYKSVDSGPNSKQKIFKWAIGVGKKYAKAKKEGLVPIGLKSKYKLAEKLVFEKIKARTGGRLRFFISGGSALPKEAGEFFEAIGITIVEGYGLTESSPVITLNGFENYKFGAAGKPIENVEVKIAEDGEILTKGPHVMKGYFKNEEATNESIDKDGWLHTGDIGYIDTEGFLFITDRKKNLLVSSGGKNIAPQHLENLFLSSKYIEQFVLIGDRRQFLSALIVPDFDAIKEFADAHKIEYVDVNDLARNDEIYKLIEHDIGNIQKDLANYERVRRFVLLDRPLSLEEGELTPTQKVKRKVLEAKYAELIEQMYKQ